MLYGDLIRNEDRIIYTSEASPEIMFLTFPDKDFIKKTGITDTEDLVPERCLDIIVCFN